MSSSQRWKRNRSERVSNAHCAIRSCLVGSLIRLFPSRSDSRRGPRGWSGRHRDGIGAARHRRGDRAGQAGCDTWRCGCARGGFHECPTIDRMLGSSWIHDPVLILSNMGVRPAPKCKLPRADTDRTVPDENVRRRTKTTSERRLNPLEVSGLWWHVGCSTTPWHGPSHRPRWAIEAADPFGRVSVRAWRDADRVSVLVENTSTGIPEDVQARLFTPFFSTKADGRGLGLTLVREILVHHEARFSLAAPLGGPTHFVFSLGLADRT